MFRPAILAIRFSLLWMPFAFAAWTAQQTRDAMKTWAASDELDDPNDELRLWRDPQETRACQFEGVDCEYHYFGLYTIQSIDLDSLNLKGSIPPWIWEVPKTSINLSNNQWYNTTVFYEDTSTGWEQGPSPHLLQSLRCSNCGFFLKAKDGETILPTEWSRYHDLTVFDMSNNPNLIGPLPMSWSTAWSKLEVFNIMDTAFCQPAPIVPTWGEFVEVGECPELPLHPPWEPIPPDPPIYPPYYEEFQPSPASTTEDTSSMTFVVSDGPSMAPFDDVNDEYDWPSSILLEASLSEFPLALSSETISVQLASVEEVF